MCGFAWTPAVRRASIWILVLATILGCAAFGYYYSEGLTTAHYDAKAHLVVARRIVDSIEPGYVQMGVHWLPLPHLLYLPLVIFDSQYHSGVLPAALSVICYILSCWLAFRIALRVTGSVAAGVFSGVLLMTNPNLLYLQSCPLTEPISMALMLGSLDALLKWRELGNGLPWASAILAALGGLCRYEGWFFLAGIVAFLGWELTTRQLRRETNVKAIVLYTAVFSVPLLIHFGYLYLALADSFLLRVARGNPAPYETYKRPLLSLIYHTGELAQVASVLPLAAGIAGIVFCLSGPDRRRRWTPLFVLWTPSLVNIAAFYWGLIYRVRYSVLLVPAIAIFASLLFTSDKAGRRSFTAVAVVAMTLPWLVWYFPDEWRYHALLPGPGVYALPICALVLYLAVRNSGRPHKALLALCVLGMYVPVLEGENRAMLPETLEHEYIEPERKQVLELLRKEYDGTRILIDMGRLAPLVYDSGLPIREFLYNEGERRHWREALREPHQAAGWMCMEIGDELWNLLQIDPHKTDRYSLAVKTENLRVYRLRSEDREALLPVRRLE
jgi:hypothetical protein